MECPSRPSFTAIHDHAFCDDVSFILAYEDLQCFVFPPRTHAHSKYVFAYCFLDDSLLGLKNPYGLMIQPRTTANLACGFETSRTEDPTRTVSYLA